MYVGYLFGIQRFMQRVVCYIESSYMYVGYLFGIERFVQRVVC